MVLKCLNLNAAFAKGCNLIFTEGDSVNSRGSNQKEVLFQSFQIDDPTQLNIDVPARRFSADYAIAEWLWYLSTHKKVQNIGQLADIWNQISDNKNEVESNYGSYFFPDQWQWVITELLSDKDSRRATIAINQPYHKWKNKKDYPCTQYIHFFIRDNKLHLGVHMRSNDLVFGFCNDVFTFSLFQQLMLNELKIKKYPHLQLGNYFHNAGSLHVYERHFKMIEKISRNYYKKIKNETTQTERYILKENWTYQEILRNNLCLPNYNMKIEEIKNFTHIAREKLFHEHS